MSVVIHRASLWDNTPFLFLSFFSPTKSTVGVELVSCDLLREGAPIEPVPPVTHWKPDAVVSDSPPSLAVFLCFYILVEAHCVLPVCERLFRFVAKHQCTAAGLGCKKVWKDLVADQLVVYLKCFCRYIHAAWNFYILSLCNKADAWFSSCSLLKIWSIKSFYIPLLLVNTL